MHREIIELTKELIRFKTMHAYPEETERCLEHITGSLQAWGVPVERMEHNGIASLLVLPQAGYAPVLLMSHLDVVDGPEAMFEPVEKDGKLYGRGSIDDKYAVALSLILLKEHLQELEQAGKTYADLPFGLLITGDEEVGGFNGAGQAAQRLKTDFCLALDGGGPKNIVVKEKGILRLKLRATGQTAHGARPWLGENAIEKLIRDIQLLQPFFAFPDADPQHWHRTMNLGRISGGKAINQVPDQAEAVFDIRYTEHDDLEALLADLQAAVSGELSVETREPLFFSGESPYLDRLLAIDPQVQSGFEHGASDIRFFSEMGIPGAVWGASGDMSAHSEEEHLVLESLKPVTAHLDTFLRQCRQKG